MTRSLRTLFIALALVGLGACTSKPLLQPEVKLPAEREFSQVQLQQAIVSALEARRWQVQRVEPTQVLASIDVRQRHRAWVSVDYSPFGFQIRYRDSQGLEYEDGKIHRNYNRWVNSLRAEILHQLNLPKTL
jgi:hypothetical protein